MRVSVIFVILLALQCFSQEYETYSSPERDEPYIEFNSFEGSYTSNSKFGGTGLHLCVDKNDQLSGSYDEIGIMQGFVFRTLDDDDFLDITASGTFYEAGNSACVQGTFEIDLTSYGFVGTFNCDGTIEQVTFEEVRTNSFRPSDSQCAVLDRVTPLSIEGSWENDDGFPLDTCVSDTQVRVSYLRKGDNAALGDPLIEGYVEGSNLLFGKIVAGTWYEEEEAGAILYFVRNTGELQAFRWTGLQGRDGRTVIDPSQYRQEDKHQVFTWSHYRGETTGSECRRFSPVKDYLLDNLPYDNEYYYFVNSAYFDDFLEPVQNFSYSSEASTLCIGAAIFLVALLI